MKIDPRSITLQGGNGSEHGRYIYRFEDGSEAELTFFERPKGLVTIDHTETPPKHRGQRIAEALVARAVVDFRAAGRKVIPACPYAYKRFREHPEWGDVLHRR